MQIGTLKSALKLPLLLLLTEAGLVATRSSSKKILIVRLVRKPRPVMVTSVPVLPEVGEIDIDCVTRRLSIASNIPSLALISWLPRSASGIRKVVVKLPRELVEVVAILLLSNRMVTLRLALKPVPCIVT